jgi:hypothetical protein
MKKIKITERQARLLENLNTKKVVKITESQYNRILELESELIKSEGDFTNQEKPDLFKEFIEELYNMNEENSSSKYNNLIKVMEVAGLLENNKIKRDSFNNNIDEVKSRITKGLNVMNECGSPYKAVDAMLEENKEEDEKLAKLGDEIKNDYDKIKQSFKGQLSSKKDYVSPFNTDDVENTYIPPVKENEDINETGVVGFDILDVEPFNQLPNTREEMGTPPNRLEVKLPDLESGDMSIVMFSKQDVINYINKFLGDNNRLPEFIDIDVERKRADIKFIDDDKTKQDRELSLKAKMSSLTDYDNIDETDTGALANAQPIGPIGFKSNFEEGLTDKIYEALKKK